MRHSLLHTYYYSSGGGEADTFRSRVLADGGTVEAFDCLESRIESLQSLGMWDDDTTGVWMPHGYKAGKIYAVKGGADMDLAFARNGTRTRINSDLEIESLAIDVPAIDYGNGSCPTLSIDAARTNLITRSQEFDHTDWTKGNVTVTANAAAAPDGTTTADRVNLAVGTSLKRLRQAEGFTGAHTISLFLKYETHQFVQIVLAGDTGPYTTIDLINKTANNAGTGTTIIRELADDWIRVEFMLTAGTPTEVNFVAVDTTGAARNANSSSTGTFLIWGAQLEAGPYATSYIPTTSGSVTRIVDSVSALDDVASYIGQTEGTLYFDGFIFSNGISRRIITISDGTIQNRIMMSMLNTGRLNVVVANGGVNGVNIVTAILPSGWYKIAATYTESVVKFFVNGVKIDEATPTAIPSMDMISVTGRGDGGTLEQYNGDLIVEALSKRELSEAEAIALTTI